MADLDPLIRYRKHGVDEKRRFLSQLYREQEKVAAQKALIEEQMQKEIDLAAEMGTVESQAYLGKYLEGARKKAQALEVTIRKMDGRIAAAQEDVRNAFSDLKKIEITQDAREAKEKAKEKRKEDIEMDDIAIDQFRRNDE